MTQSIEQLVDSILAPVSTTAFFEKYWEKKPLHIARSNSNQFSSLLTLTQLDELIHSQELYFPSVQLTQSDRLISSGEYTDETNKIIPLRLIEQYSNGATIVISQAHQLFNTLSDVSRKMQSAFQMRCQTNVYLSPPGNQGFNAHYDTHDVLILQVSGKKYFSIYNAGVELPFSHEKFDSNVKLNSEKVEEISLEPGDTLYIPRGVVHDAQALDQDEPSLHITLGAFPITICDLLQEALQLAAEKEVGFRRSLPYSTTNQSEQELESTITTARKLFNQANSAENIIAALSRIRDNTAIDCQQNSIGLLSRVQQAKNLCLTSSITVRNDMVMNTERQGVALKLRTYGQILEFSEPMSTAVEWLVAERKGSIEKLPGLDDEQKLALARRLLQENIIELSDPCRRKPRRQTQ